MARRLGAIVLLVAVAMGAAFGDWDVYRTHPFVEATADGLAGDLRHPAREVSVSGLQNDWAHAAVGLRLEDGDGPVEVTVGLMGEPEVTRHLTLRVAGFVAQKSLGYCIDPIFADPGSLDLDLPTGSTAVLRDHVRNLPNIHGFPTVTVTQSDPVLLWLTLGSRGMAPGHHRAGLRFVGGDGTVREVPVRVSVGAYALPVENPLRTWGWQYGREWLDDYLQYGVNVVHIDDDMPRAREVGYRFFVFRFNPAWKMVDPADYDLAEANARLEQVQQMIGEMSLGPDEWALYMKDEPNDESAPNQLKWSEWIHERWLEARLLFNPGWGPGPTNEWASVEGTVEPLAPHAGVWLPYSHWLWDGASGRSLPLMRESADEVWFYEIMGSSYARRPTVGRGMLRSLGWVAWRYRLQGACWYSLNAYQVNMWGDNSRAEEYACTYGPIPGRGLEAVRQGLQEYKRLHEMDRLGVRAAETDAFAARLLSAASVQELDTIRREMDARLIAAAQASGE